MIVPCILVLLPCPCQLGQFTLFFPGSQQFDAFLPLSHNARPILSPPNSWLHKLDWAVDALDADAFSCCLKFSFPSTFHSPEKKSYLHQLVLMTWLVPPQHHLSLTLLFLVVLLPPIHIIGTLYKWCPGGQAAARGIASWFSQEIHSLCDAVVSSLPPPSFDPAALVTLHSPSLIPIHYFLKSCWLLFPIMKTFHPYWSLQDVE